MAVQCGMLAAVSGRFHPAFVFLLFYGQVVGSLVKVFAFFQPQIQRWTRQHTGVRGRIQSVHAWILTVASVMVFVIGVAWLGGVFNDTRRFDVRNPDGGVTRAGLPAA